MRYRGVPVAQQPMSAALFVLARSYRILIGADEAEPINVGGAAATLDAKHILGNNRPGESFTIQERGEQWREGREIVSRVPTRGRAMITRS